VRAAPEERPYFPAGSETFLPTLRLLINPPKVLRKSEAQHRPRILWRSLAFDGIKRDVASYKTGTLPFNPGMMR
jgi:hypothetical protein